MRISTIISYPLGWLIGANCRCARKSVPVLKPFRAGRGVCKDPFTGFGEVCSIFCQCFISHVILGSVHMYSLSSPTARRWISASASMHTPGKCNYAYTYNAPRVVSYLVMIFNFDPALLQLIGNICICSYFGIS
jgi:hypothetical protein